MTKTVSAKEMQKVDQHTIEKIGIPVEVLMERAALAVSQTAFLILTKGLKEVIKVKKKKLFTFPTNPEGKLKNKKILIVCGKGNNGADGLATARQLHLLGAMVTVYLIKKEAEYTGIPKLQLSVVKKLKIKVKHIENLKSFEKDLKTTNLVIDAVFGTGFSGQVKEPLGSIFNNINQSKKTILSIDIPSGLNGTTGEASKNTIKSDVTVTFQYLKTGLVKKDGKKFSGIVLVWNIGLVPYKIG